MMSCIGMMLAKERWFECLKFQEVVFYSDSR